MISLVSRLYVHARTQTDQKVRKRQCRFEYERTGTRLDNDMLQYRQ